MYYGKIIRQNQGSFRHHARHGRRTGDSQSDHKWSEFPWCQSVGAHLCYFHRFARIECQFHGGDYRCHVDIPSHGSYHWYGIGDGYQRPQSYASCGEELRCGHSHQCSHGDGVFSYHTIGRGTVGIACAHFSHYLRRAHCHLWWCCRHSCPMHQGQG